MKNRSFSISLVILLLTIGLVFAISRRGEPVVVKTNLENIPMEIAGFKGTEDFFSESVYKELNADSHVYRHYRAEEGRQVDLYIGYYGTAKGGRTGHNPYGCLPGSGWGINEAKKEILKTKYYPDGVAVNHILARRGDNYGILFHWYQTAGSKVLATGIQQNVQRFIGRVFYNRDDGAFVEVSVFTKENGIEEARALVRSFSEKVLDLLPNYWPIEQ